MRVLFSFLFSFLLISTSVFAQKYELVWSDEFDQEELDLDTWTPFNGFAYNNEWQFYMHPELSPDNLYVEDDYLYIVGLRDNEGHDWTSGRIKSENNFEFQYGKVEIKAKLPAGKGLWPAFWMLGSNRSEVGWPYSGEIDIMEFRGHETNKTQGTVHFSSIPPPGSGNSNSDRKHIGKDYTLPTGDLTTDFHLYQFEWTDSTMTWYINDVEFFHLTRDQIENQTTYFPFDQPFYLILNLAIGGNYLGSHQPDETTPDRNEVIVDYVRVYQDANIAPVIESEFQGEFQVEPQQWIELNAEVTDNDGNVERVEFYIDDKEVAEFTEPPFSYNWRPGIEGCNNFSIKAYDNYNSVGKYESTLVVGSGCEKAAFNNESASFPGILQLEHYDYGGQNISYYDLTPDTNTGNASGNDFRMYEAVDLITDENENGNYLITDTKTGEWTSYQINVDETGIYDMEFRAIPGSGSARIDFLLNGDLLTYFTRIIQNESDGDYKVMTKSNIELEEGLHNLEMHIAQDGGNVKPDYLKTTLKESTSNDELDSESPQKIKLKQNYPNPFNPLTTIAIELQSGQNISLNVFNTLGQHVTTLHNGALPSGTHYFKFDASELSSGLYYYQLSSSDGILTRNMLLVK